jgi:hypothetical protein
MEPSMRQAILVLLAILLQSLSVSASDCAFLLWAEDSWINKNGETVTWTLIQSERSLDQCEANMQAKIEQVAESSRSLGTGKVEIRGNIVSMSVVRDDFFSSHTTRYLCVPDRIDPRPKARS